MTSQGRAVAWLLVVLFLASSAFLSSSLFGLRMAGTPAGRAGAPEGGLLGLIGRKPAFSFGFRNFLADIAWLKAVQVAGVRRMTKGDYDDLSLLVHTVNNFDPRFDVPYFLGGLVLGDSPDHVPQAIDTLERGWRNHPENWRFPFYLGYLRYFSLGDPVGGGRMLESAARLTGSPPYLPMLVARMLSEGRQPETALAFLSAMMKQETDPARQEILNRRIREVIVERDVQMLEKAVEAYRKKNGALPPGPSALVREGLIEALPAEPNGGKYLMSPEGTVRSSKMPYRLKVFRVR
ncbi:MAG: hypothetical protein WBX49_10115 [Candidatus Deferrimicrobiaceae bacterium]